MTPLAHSARPQDGIPAQTYDEHISNVRIHALASAKASVRFRPGGLGWFSPAVEWAACYHDLGKLHESNQLALSSGNRSARLDINHVDAGTAHLLRLRLRESAMAIYGHHLGLADVPSELAKAYNGGRPFRDDRVHAKVDSELEGLLRTHRQVAGADPPDFIPPKDVTGLQRRLLLSCLVDADHSDTANHYRESVEASSPKPRWDERSASLDCYVAALAATGGPRSSYRSSLYKACKAVDANQPLLACDSPVGSGKTTSVMAALLQMALWRQLRHVFVVLPYTNIIRQSVQVYRQALTLPGEDPEEVVAAHHHLAEFQSLESRHLTALWRSPIIVTTAVQFFETLGAATTARLRKLHELPGSAVFVDEAHAAMAVHLWPFMWNQLDELSKGWGCQFILGSGSLSKFWENRLLVPHLKNPRPLPMLALPVLRIEGGKTEVQRVEFRSRADALDLLGLADWILQVEGPRVVVMNTVQSAAVLAMELRTRGNDVLHLSTAISPGDREGIIERIRQKLLHETNGDWTLVATSCVEAGLDFDFAAGFRERSRAASLIQLGGRVNRHGSRRRSIVWDFVTDDPQLTKHPAFDAPRRVVRQLFDEQHWNTLDVTDLMTLSLERELIESSGTLLIEHIAKLDGSLNYPELAQATRLIPADTQLVVVDPRLLELLNSRVKVGWRRLLAGSVQLWSTKITKLRLESLDHLPGVFRWGYDYDPDFLGIMAGVLRLAQGEQDGYFLV